MKKILLFQIVTLLLICSCSKDDDPTPLPEDVSITILNYDIDDNSVLLRATEPNSDLTGFWSLESGTTGNFIDSTDPNTTFTANLFENHKIRWTLSNGVDSIYEELSVNISDNFTLLQLLNEGVKIDELLNEYTIQELLEANVSIEQLLQAGVTVQNLIDAEVSLIQIVEANVSSLTLINLGVSKEDLQAENIIAKIPGINLYILNYFREKYDHLSATNFCNNLIIGNFVDWHLPTIDELRTIFANRSQVLFEFTDEDYWSSSFSHNGTDENGTNPNYFTKNMTDGFESTFYGFEKRVIPVIQL